MSLPAELKPVMSEYPADLQPCQIEPLNSAGGFSGAQLWWIETDRGPACLRRWPQEHPQPCQLEFIQAVLWHVDQEGFDLVPVPYETRSHAGYVRHDGHLWEITPWMPGCADYHRLPCPVKLQAAMTALAQFHRAAASFPLPEATRLRSPGIVARAERLRQLAGGGICRIQKSTHSGDWPELPSRAHQLCELFHCAAGKVSRLVEHTRHLEVDLQPCIRDVWHDHILFERAEVTGIIDFGAMRAENVAADIARLLGSLVRDDAVGWHVGLAAYQSTRALSESETLLVTAFDQTSVLMSGIQWLDWIYCEGRQFAERDAVISRIDEVIARLIHLANHVR